MRGSDITTEIHSAVADIATRLCQRRETLAIAESCTGGLVAQFATAWPGSSAWFDCGLVTYSNRAKRELLGVPEAILRQDGAVSASTVLAMADGLRTRRGVDWVVSISGIAGPDGGTSEKPVGTVWIAWGGVRLATSASRFHFRGNRTAVRNNAALAALSGLALLIAAAEGYENMSV